MQIIYCRNPEELARWASDAIIREAGKARPFRMCVATGDSPRLTYQYLAERKQELNPGNIHIIKLDEWGGIPMEHPQTCEHFIRKNLLIPLQISDKNYTRFHSNPSNPQHEIQRVQQELERLGGIDVCVLGMGSNGHIAFNEPGEELHAACHIAELTQASLTHPMALQMDQKPAFGLTLGMADILASGKIIMIIQGKEKENIIRQFLKGKITTRLPATFLWMHPEALCFIDSESYQL
jgi:galactosamine-6-phosphate isomerase